MQFRGGSIHLFRLFGVHVYLHWSWIFVAVFMIQQRSSGPLALPLASNIALYLALFGIVLMHEFGHALACKSVGGRAEQITLWPLGGIAYVDPPLRPGAVLWSIAAGPLVNVALIPVTLCFLGLAYFITGPDSPWTELTTALAITNGVLLVFNLLPIYPLDGGQILQALIWYVAGRSMSLLIASVIGLVGAAGLITLGLALHGGFWLPVIGLFMIMQSWNGLRFARRLRTLEAAPRHHAFTCPWCLQAPPALPLWPCPACNSRFDVFADYGRCPSCTRTFLTAPCPFCSHQFPLQQWGPPPAVVTVPPIYQPLDLPTTPDDSFPKSP